MQVAALARARGVRLRDAGDRDVERIDAVVIRIDPKASFTPENTYFRDDRVKQVIGVKLQLRGEAGYGKPGMPADGEILVEGSAWPAAKPSRLASVVGR